MIFIGALVKLLASGRVSGAGAALAGFGLVLFGLTTLQQGMGGLAERLHPADLPAVLAGADARWWRSVLGVLVLIVVGLVMTALMQSSTAAITVTLSAYFAGAIGLDQGCALIIGQNVGTATSSALAAIGASATAKRLAIAYVLFKLIAAAIALALFPVVIPLLMRASSTIDGVTLLAGYHTAYNVVGVLVLLPLIDRFTRLVERILPERGSPLTRYLDPSALETPIIAVEAVRRMIARSLEAVCGSVAAAVAAASRGEPIHPVKDAISVPEAAAALRQAQVFLSDVSGPPDSDDEQRRLTSTLHALDHASRLAETANGNIDSWTLRSSPDNARARQLCAEAMLSATAIAGEVEAPLTGLRPTPASPGADATSAAAAVSTEEALVRLERSATQLEEMQRSYRSATLGAVADGTLSADAAILRVETVRSLQALAYHAWRSAAHLVGRGG
jgi:phosphate:Na+ symporter